MDQYNACLAKACLTYGNLTTLYTGNVPSNFSVPCLYYPPDDLGSSKSALNNYAMEHTIYAKVFAKDRETALDIATSIVSGITMNRFRIPIYDEEGTATGELLRIDPPNSRIIDEGVAQITLVYKIQRKYPEPDIPKAKYFHTNYI